MEISAKKQMNENLVNLLEMQSWEENQGLLSTCKPRALLMDLDGTLLDNNKVFSTYTQQFLEQYFQQSQKNPHLMQLAMCTGRHFAAVKNTVLPLFARYYPQHLHIVSGGAVIVKANGAVVWENLLPSKMVETLTKGIRARNGGYGFGQGDVFYCDPSTLEERSHAFANVDFQLAINLEHWQTPLLVVSHLNPAVEEFVGQFSDQLSIKKMIGYSGRPYLDITQKGVTKALAVLEWARRAQLPLAKIAAVGDSANDLEALVTAGYGFAMANATPELKAVADGILKLSNVQNGVAHLIAALTNES